MILLTSNHTFQGLLRAVKKLNYDKNENSKSSGVTYPHCSIEGGTEEIPEGVDGELENIDKEIKQEVAEAIISELMEDMPEVDTELVSQVAENVLVFPSHTQCVSVEFS